MAPSDEVAVISNRDKEVCMSCNTMLGLKFVCSIPTPSRTNLVLIG
jgi:hypothetical protein